MRVRQHGRKMEKKKSNPESKTNQVSPNTSPYPDHTEDQKRGKHSGLDRVSSSKPVRPRHFPTRKQAQWSSFPGQRGGQRLSAGLRPSDTRKVSLSPGGAPRQEGLFAHPPLERDTIRRGAAGTAPTFDNSR